MGANNAFGSKLDERGENMAKARRKTDKVAVADAGSTDAKGVEIKPKGVRVDVPSDRSSTLPLATTAFAGPAAPTGGVDAQSLTRTEWLLTNALGGFAMGTASGIPTRRYHALLIGATQPPVGRIAALSATIDVLVVNPGTPDEKTFDLSTFAFKGPEFQPAVHHPGGVSRLSRFEHDLTARWEYVVEIAPGERVRIERELCLVERANACMIGYSIVHLDKGRTPLRLHIRPLVAMRDMHALNRQGEGPVFSSRPLATHVHVTRDGHDLRLLSDNAVFAPDQQWWNSFAYALDQERGQDYVEDLYSPGYFLLDVPGREAHSRCIIHASLSLEHAPEPKVLAIGSSVGTRRERLGRVFQTTKGSRTLTGVQDKALAALVRAGDDFVVARARTTPSIDDPTDSEALTLVSVIAGYPWFSDWGRDTCIAMPGLMLATGRFDDARRTLSAFAKARKDGIVPNLFSDQTGQAEYNTVDASLWFIQAACAYAHVTDDRAIFETDLLPACLDIIGAYRRGTMFNIAMDPMDKLITAGNPGTQLTWMDARRDGTTFTPRHGKAVEINALWCSGLRLVAEQLRSRDPSAGANLLDLAETAARGFRAAFWNAGAGGAGSAGGATAGYLHDCLTPTDQGTWVASSEVRPNQIFAVSLPHSPLGKEQAASVIRIVRERLLTPRGVRTLEPGHPNYRARYEGSLYQRDAAYHNGTAWPWLLGPLAEAVMRHGEFSAASRREALAILQPTIDALLAPVAGDGACVGQIAEIFDAQPPQHPQGCTAQAWSVGEVLRTWLLATEEHPPLAPEVR